MEYHSDELMEDHSDELMEDNVVDDNFNPNEGSHMSMIEDVSEMSIVQNNDNIKTNNAIPLCLNEYTEHFQSVSKKFLFKYCTCVYFQNAEAKIIEEIDKIKSVFDVQTRIDEYVNIIKTELIIKNMKEIVEMENCGVVYMLRKNQHDKLKWMYNFLSSVNGGVKVMFDGMRPYFNEVGQSVVLKTNENYNFKSCVQSLLDLKGKFDELMVNLFNNDPLFDEIIGDEFDNFLKLNSSIPRHLSYFIDYKLRKGMYTYVRNEYEDDIDKVMYMIKYLKDKNDFQLTYQINLSNRLLNFVYISMKNENKIISKLNSAYANGHGHVSFISKLNSMMQDKFVLSKMIMSNYKDRVDINKCIFGISKSFDFDIDVHVITSVNWPINQKTKQYTIPSFGLCAFNEFNTIYKETILANPKKKLMLLPQYGTVELNATFYGKPCPYQQLANELSINNIKRSERKVKLIVTTYQMCVLDMFNSHNTLTFKQIVTETMIPRFPLIKALKGMIEHGNYLEHLIIKIPSSQVFNFTDKFYINESFECSKGSLI